MPDTKISAMPAATTFAGSDVVPAVQAAANVKVSRDILLTCNGGDKLYLSTGAGGKAGVKNPTSTALIEIDSTDNIHIQNSVGTITIDFVAGSPANWNVSPPPTIEQAIDRMASALVGLLGGPIP